MNDFFNTINLTGQELAKAIRTAQKQDERVLLLFVEKNGPMTPTECSLKYNKLWQDIPITSIRRAISNLTNAGYLEKTDQKGPGMYGKQNYKWQVRTYEGQLNLFS